MSGQSFIPKTSEKEDAGVSRLRAEVASVKTVVAKRSSEAVSGTLVARDEVGSAVIHNAVLTGTARIPYNAGVARVLTSDGSGNAIWQAPAVSYYEEADFSTTFNGFFSPTTANFRVIRVGKLITLTMLDSAGTGISGMSVLYPGYLTSNTGLPTKFWPASPFYTSIVVQTASESFSLGALQITQMGTLSIRVGANGQFPAQSIVGFQAFSVSWCGL